MPLKYQNESNHENVKKRTKRTKVTPNDIDSELTLNKLNRDEIKMLWIYNKTTILEYAPKSVM